MKLVAVTICINYSDYLACVVANRAHFDRWVVVTVREDRATHELCARYGIECINSALLQPDGKDFHAVDNKGPVLNEGIAHVLSADADAMISQPSALNSQPIWAVVLDADVLLPRYFGERVRAMPLEAGCLYAMGGRKVCETREQFEMLRECEPWDRLVARNSQAIGYFNLFALEALPNRYPIRTGKEGSAHDDFLFTTSFAPSKRRVLPFTAIHLGEYGRNWGGRVSLPFVEGLELRAERPHTPTGGVAVVAQLTAAVVGYFPGGRWREVTRGFSPVYLVDHFCVHVCSGSGMIEGERAVLRAQFDAETVGDARLRMLGVHSVENVGEIPDGSLELLYIPGEVAPEWLCRALPHWLPKLRDGGTICGDLYGLPHWPDATYTLALLLGTPERTDASGRWWKTFKVGARPLPIPEDSGCNEKDGLLFVTVGKELEPALLALHAARKHWSGPILVSHWGAEDESLRISCARLGVEFCHAATEFEEEAPLDSAMATSPFRRTLLMNCEDILVGPPDFSAVPPRAKAPTIWDAVFPDKAEVPLHGWVSAEEFSGNEELPVLRMAGGAEEWTEAAWERRCEVEADAAVFNAATVKLPAGVTVFTVVAPEDAGDFQRNWLTWRFLDTETVIVLAGIKAEEFWIPNAEKAKLVAISAKQAADTRWLLGAMASLCKTDRMLFLSPQAAAMPGAELWPDIPPERCAAHMPPVVREEVLLTGNLFIPREYAVLMPKAEVANLAENIQATDIAVALGEWAYSVDREEVATSDVAKTGIRLPERYRFATEAKNRAQTGTGILQRRKDGLLELAEDVVVISLPERTDRRVRMSEMMEREGVWFRYVDGVRVKHEEINAFETSEVHLHTFKLVGGAEKFLQGVAGCRRAHLRVFEEAARSDIQSLLVVEDDMSLNDGWLDTYTAALAELPAGWLQLYLSTSNYRAALPFSKNLRRLRGSYQTTAILYSRAGIEAALRCLRTSRCEIDVWMGNHLHPFGCSFGIEPRIACQKGGYSDIMSFDRGTTA